MRKTVVSREKCSCVHFRSFLILSPNADFFADLTVMDLALRCFFSVGVFWRDGSSLSGRLRFAAGGDSRGDGEEEGIAVRDTRELYVLLTRGVIVMV